MGFFGAPHILQVVYQGSQKGLFFFYGRLRTNLIKWIRTPHASRERWLLLVWRPAFLLNLEQDSILPKNIYGSRDSYCSFLSEDLLCILAEDFVFVRSHGSSSACR